MPSIDRSRIATLMERERQTFRDRHPRSGELEEQAKPSLLFGVPMNWMIRWPGDWPVFVDHAEGRALHRRRRQHLRGLLSRGHRRHGGARTEGLGGRDRRAGRQGHHPDAARPRTPPGWEREMTRRFKVPLWQFCLHGDRRQSASSFGGPGDHRPPAVVVHNWNYHGSVDETFAQLDDDGNLRPARRTDRSGRSAGAHHQGRGDQRPGGAGGGLAPGDVAAVLFEPALTNIGIVLPDPATTRASVICARSTARSWSSTRRTRSAPVPVAARRHGTSTQTW
jgi:hypothetical protein